MSRRLNTFVHVRGVVYGPADEVPDDIAKLITNPNVWADDQPVDRPAEDAERAAPARQRRTTGKKD